MTRLFQDEFHMLLLEWKRLKMRVQANKNFPVPGLWILQQQDKGAFPSLGRLSLS